MSIEDNLDSDELKEWQDFVSFQREHMIKLMEQSAMVMSIVPANADDIDVGYALQTGAAILLDKPIVVIAAEGREIPPKLAKVADKILRIDIDTEEGRQRIAEAIMELKPK